MFQLVQRILAWSQGDPVLLYSRFFLHSISLEAESDFWQAAREVARGHKEAVVVVEFRDDADKDLQKETAPHFRRFSSGDQVVQRAMRFGFDVIWKADGRGMAKFGADDAHVTRLFLRVEP